MILFLLAKSQSFCQSGPEVIITKTPEVSAFNKNIETPVSKYTGIPEISIPLYEIVMKGVKVPVTLDYNAGGIRVDQEATWVGLGWSLNYGGQVSRKVRGLPDEYYFLNARTTAAYTVDDFMQLPDVGPVPNSQNQEDRHGWMNAAKYGQSDYMPDEFYYSVLGYSGKFMYNQLQDKFILFPKEDIDVQKYAAGTIKLNSWNLKLPDGISVDFGKEGYTSQQGTVLGSPANIINSWQIKAIRNNYSDSINYTYENSSYRMYKIYGEQVKLHTDFAQESNITIDNPLQYNSQVKLISFPNGKMEFITQARVDMPGTALSAIKVYDSAGNLIKTINFSYSYFYGNTYDILSTINPLVAADVPDDYRSKRLKLDFISITAPNTQTLKYTFDYYTATQMPSKYSFAQDHWGYYNGIANMGAFSFIPKLHPSFIGGDRSVKPDKSNVFTLKSIVYPEGGKKEFVYENNTAGIWNTPPELLASYQDDNFPEKYAAISISSYSRNTSYPAPDQTSGGVRYFRKQFTVSGQGYTTFENGWSIATNFGISALEQGTNYSGDNVAFTLERINADKSRTLIKTFNTTDSNYPYNNAPPRDGNDSSILPISAGNYEMTVKMTYLNPVNSAADNQNYNLSFFIKWREMDPTKNMLNVGGLRIRDINYYDQSSVLVKKKSYNYINPFAYPAIPTFTSGRIISFPQYMERRLRAYKDSYGVDKTDWIANFTSNSVLPLETTAGSFAGYEYVDEYDVDISNPVNKLKTAYHYSFDQPYFSEFYPQRTKGLLEPKEWGRGKLLYTKYFKDDDLVRSEDYEYNYWSPHLPNDTQEDYVEEISTDFISFQTLKNSCSCDSNYPDDFYDLTGGTNSCVYYYYTPFHNHVLSTAHQPILSWGANPPISSATCDYYTTVPYFKHFTAFDKIKSRTISTYDEAQNAFTEVENYNYERTPTHYQLTKTTNSSSAGASLISAIKYPQDLSLTGTAEAGRLKLINKHRINTVLNQSTTKNSAVLTTKTDYKVDPVTNFAVPDLIKTNTLNGADEVRARYYSYDNKGNPLSVSKEGGPRTNYKWGYNSQYPIAEFSNALPDEFYSQNFESSTFGFPANITRDTVNAHSGNYSGLMVNSGTTEKNILSNDYITLTPGTERMFNYSGWVYSNGPQAELFLFMYREGETAYYSYVNNVASSQTGKWVYLSKNFLVPDDVAKMRMRLDNNGGGNVWFDDVRIQPLEAASATYTYDPLVGVTSKTDNKGQTTIYEYDSFQRLINIKDQNGNIIKNNSYRIKN